MKLLWLSIWLLSQSTVMQINGYCLRQSLPMENGAARHMWRATGWPADTGSCAGPAALLRSATDGDGAAAAGLATPNATATGKATAASVQAVSLANYVYQCASKRAPNLSPDLTSASSLLRPYQLERQQLTLPAIAMNLNPANLWPDN
ncbi:uncharacterized protein LOC108652038 isoform X2 [Drosophila navojoa]|uniref:uncharacterized protein LOC108652038 isoform X2 n=1 Tax=Drosophila navojoa TaxID=7232 RepID=UPI0008471564|nr:uncharacterized protein LOC108652038 isoform X2 [Drosophila navojoa]